MRHEVSGPLLTVVFLVFSFAGEARENSHGGRLDRVVMNDGTVVEGQIFRIQALHILIITPDGNKTIPMDQVERFERGGRVVVPGGGAESDEQPDKPPVPVDEDEVRRRFNEAVKQRDGDAALAALRALNAASEAETFQLLKSVLATTDAAQVLRIAAAEAIGRADDVEGGLIEPLCKVLLDQKEDASLRLACAKALEACEYKEQPVDALIRVISNISNTQRDLWEFGAECTRILDRVAGVSFGADKNTPAKWQEWWKKNRAAVRAADAKKRSDLKKAAKSAAGKDPAAEKDASGSAPERPARKVAPKRPPRAAPSAAEKNERDARSLLGLARSWRMNGDDARAARILRRVLEEYPDTDAAGDARRMLREITR